MSRSIKKRLARVEEKLADLAQREALANCICRSVTLIHSDEEWEAERNRKCPVHELRQDHFIQIRVVDNKGVEITAEQ
jgi:hypothetical protein